jgi:TonB family protein
MGRSSRTLVSISILLLITSFAVAGKQTLTVRIWFFQGSYMEGQPRIAQTTIYPISSTPELASLKALSGGSELEFKAAVIDALLEKENLSSLKNLFFFKQAQREGLAFQGQTFLGRQTAYRVDLLQKSIGPAQLALRLMISKAKDDIIRVEKNDRTMLRNAYETTLNEEKMEVIVNQAFSIGIDDPVLIDVPSESRVYFAVVKLTVDEPEPKRKTRPSLKVPPMRNLLPAPPSIEKVLPSYPDELRRRGIKGEVGFRIAIDDKGVVRMVQVLTPLHPYLDYVASQALWRWRFEPVIRQGKPAQAAFDLVYKFDPRAYSEEMTSVENAPASRNLSTKQETGNILEACAEYCRKLADAALFYICEETIKEITHSLVNSDRLAEIVLRARDTAIVLSEREDGNKTVWAGAPQIMSSTNIDRLSYECDYQMIRRLGEIVERRIVVKKNGRRVTDRVELLEEGRYNALTPIVSALSIFDSGRQALFHYRVLKEDKLFGRPAIVIEASPILGDADGVRSAKVWLEKGSYGILRCEIEGVPIDGYEDILSEAVTLNIRPFFLRTYEYQVEHEGVFLPSRTNVRIEYPSLVPDRRETKSKINLEYKDFKYFTVQTGHDIKK